MANKLSYSLLAIIVVLIILATLLSGCLITSPENFVVVPTNDITPPTVGMIISDNTGNNFISVNETSQPATMQTSELAVTVIAGATDKDGGIKAVRLWATYTHSNLNQIEGPGLVGEPIKQNVSNANVGESTLKNRFFMYDFELERALHSEQGWTRVEIDVWTEGENFYSGKTRTPQVTIIYPPYSRG